MSDTTTMVTGYGILGALAICFYIYTQKTSQKKEDVIVQKGSAILTGGKEKEKESTEAKKRKKKPAKKAAPKAEPKPEPAPTPKAEKPAKPAKQQQQQQPKAQKKAAPVVKKDESESEDEAVEEDIHSMARSMAAFRSGAKVPGAAPATPSNGSGSEKPKEKAKGKKGKVAAASWSSDEEAFGSSTNPSDMLEKETGGPGVLRITPSQQPPRPQKQRNVSDTPSAGVHASKNQKKRERQKAARAEELAQQEAARAQYRAQQRAEAAKGPQKPQPVTALSKSSAWADSQKTVEVKKSTKDVGLLDTFERTSSLEDSSMWETVPAELTDDGWQEVAVKKKPVKEDTTDEESAPAPAAAPVEAPKPKKDVQTLKKELSKKNAFAALGDSEWNAINGWEVQVSRN